MTTGKALARHILAPVLVAVALVVSAPLGAEPVSRRSSHIEQPAMDRFVSDLLSKMTLREKIGQLNLLTTNWDKTGPMLSDNYREAIEAGEAGGIFNAHTARDTRMLQQLAVEGTRLGIPLLFGYDVLHGFKTIFPIPLGEAASWDLEAIEQSARVAAVEASAAGLNWVFAPMLDIARDPRWGRIAEGAGEDVFLASQIARVRVKGFQGDDLGALDTVLACAKHYAAYGAAQAGREYNTTDISRRQLWQTYLPPFHAAVDAGVATVMSAFNDLNGVPATANEYLLHDILKTRWGFEGFVVSDYNAINELVQHGVARDERQAALLAFNAGVDMDMQGESFVRHLPELVKEGKVGEVAIDRSVRRILEMKYRLGLFADPYRYSDEERERREIYKPAHLEAARDMARKSIVLLKNEGALLPLAAEGISLAVIGPLADSEADMIGPWSAAGESRGRPVSLLEGIRARVGDDVAIYYAKGASYDFDATDVSGFGAAIEAAKKADIIVAAMGESRDMSGEAASRTSLQLPGTQKALLKELKRLGKPIVLVLMNGRPLAITWENDNVDAILETWFTGTEGGNAIADVLFGDYNPSGKLPVTFPRNVGQVPIYYNMKNTGRPYDANGTEQKYRSRYLDAPNTPLYPFGYGLSYTTFAYSDLSLDKSEMGAGDTMTVSVRVTNSGHYDGEETVQLYTRDLVGSVTRPVRELKGFRKIFLKKGESKSVKFELRPADLAFYRRDMSYGAEAGDFQVFVGGNSVDVLAAGFRLSEDVAVPGG